MENLNEPTPTQLRCLKRLWREHRYKQFFSYMKKHSLNISRALSEESLKIQETASKNNEH